MVVLLLLIYYLGTPLTQKQFFSVGQTCVEVTIIKRKFKDKLENETFNLLGII